jgi:hypothetical protein
MWWMRLDVEGYKKLRDLNLAKSKIRAIMQFALLR